MIHFKIVMLIMLIHFLADFGLQTDQQAKEKSTDIEQLWYHVLIYSTVWMFASYCLLGTIWKPIFFGLITLMCHYWTDYYSSRIGKEYWDKGDTHNGFVIVGADQFLHLVQLIGMYWLLR